MKTAVEHSVYGIITYEESIWTGSRTLYVNGQALEKQSRNTFVLVRDKQTTYFTLKGSYLSGLKLTVDNQTFPIIAGPKWYEVLIVVTMALLYLVWANVPTLVVHLRCHRRCNLRRCFYLLFVSDETAAKPGNEDSHRIEHGSVDLRYYLRSGDALSLRSHVTYHKNQEARHRMCRAVLYSTYQRF